MKQCFLNLIINIIIKKSFNPALWYCAHSAPVTRQCRLFASLFVRGIVHHNATVLAAAGDHGPVLGDAEAKDGPLVGRPDGLGDRVVAPAPHKDVAVRVPSEQVAWRICWLVLFDTQFCTPVFLREVHKGNLARNTKSNLLQSKRCFQTWSISVCTQFVGCLLSPHIPVCRLPSPLTN